jgi:hypothetical protein
MEVFDKEYSIVYQADTATVTCKGSLSLNGSQEYEPMLKLLLQASTQPIEQLTLDVRDLTFLNSSGINTFTKFIIHVRKQNELRLKIVGREAIAWQVKLSRNLQRLLPTLEITTE